MQQPHALTILTGASRGLGAAMAQQLLTRGAWLLTLSRHPDPALDAKAKAAGASLEQWAIDLADGASVAARLEKWLRARKETFTSATLINNAALVGKPAVIGAIDADSLVAVVRVGLEAPMLLCHAFLRATRDWRASRRILNISSGAGQMPLAGAAAYCAVKAGLDHLSRVIALEEARHPNPVRIVSLAPGVIDTDMQVDMRESDPNTNPSQPMFAAMKSSGQLVSPDAAAARVLSYLERADFGDKPVASVSD